MHFFCELYNTDTHKHVDILIDTEKVSQIITLGAQYRCRHPSTHILTPSEKVSWQISRLLPRGTLFFKLHGTYSPSMHARTHSLKPCPHKHIRDCYYGLLAINAHITYHWNKSATKKSRGMWTLIPMKDLQPNEMIGSTTTNLTKRSLRM